MQKINHFPRNYELCRKDLMAKNLKVAACHTHAAVTFEAFPPCPAAGLGTDVRYNCCLRWCVSLRCRSFPQRMKRQADRQGGSEVWNFFPQTYTLPIDWGLFVEDFKQKGGVWIAKPVGRAQVRAPPAPGWHPSRCYGTDRY